MTNALRKRTIAAAVFSVLGVAATVAASAKPIETGQLRDHMLALNLPGIGLVVKSDCAYKPKPCKRHAIVVPSDGAGEVRITGLEAGTYAVEVIGGTQEVQMQVGEDGQLAFVAVQGTKDEFKQSVARGKFAYTSKDYLPARNRADNEIWAVPMAWSAGDGGETGIWELGRGSGVIVAVLAGAAIADVNTAGAEEIAKSTGTSLESAEQIVAIRERGGRFADIGDFAKRTCPTVAIDMNLAALTIGDAAILLSSPGSKASVPGFQCGPEYGEEFALYGKRHNYVGHVTLLR